MRKIDSHEVFYVPPDRIADGEIVLADDELRHAVRVKRHVIGDIIDVIDGEGLVYRARLTVVGRQEARAEIIGRQTEMGEPSYALTIAIGVPKSQSRFEVFLEKATELGVSRIFPLTTERTERIRLNTTRARKILISATKQSGRSRVPSLEDVTLFRDFVVSRGDGVGLILHEEEREKGLFDLADQISGQNRIGIAVGPEGGFSPAEVLFATGHGWKTVSLGPHRLRTETAGIVAAAGICLINSELGTRNAETES